MAAGRRDERAADDAVPPKVSQLVDQWLAAEGLTDLKSLGSVRQGWSALVGEEVSAHAVPVSLQEGCLVVAVDHSAWGTELKFLEKRIRRSVESQLGTGAMTRLEVRVRRTDGLE